MEKHCGLFCLVRAVFNLVKLAIGIYLFYYIGYFDMFTTVDYIIYTCRRSLETDLHFFNCLSKVPSTLGQKDRTLKLIQYS